VPPGGQLETGPELTVVRRNQGGSLHCRRLTMRVKRHQKIASRSVHDVRAFLRRNPFGFGPRNITKHFGLDITDDLVVAGLIERDKNSYRTTAAGDRLAAAKFIPPINRAKANRIVAEFLQRVDAINANNELLMRVKEVRAFGRFHYQRARSRRH
jgi:hypothetical protein